ncbi:hypothetical protein LOTGIDRAFT_117073 [Lottia gigantea]|uniref:Zinc finger FYVE domain-containing protein 1 n=1 Tax=Lottia gigantea TaxID=225164 RepID=V3ZVF6_LOTGI|nr:hypothetical protein LOTGIDRAFT_117073 [Lottia gigantea]ESO95488.1 hypothetical protein LOTGIDRAFT_117073 [Lottia gigantea]
MKAAGKKGSCRSSIRLCEEKFSCETQNPAAAIVCFECGDAAQCLKCDSAIHSMKKNQNHTRETIPSPKPDLLCQVSELNGQCKSKNYADVYCQDCYYRFCFDCNDKYHQRSDKAKHNFVDTNSFQTQSFHSDSSSVPDICQDVGDMNIRRDTIEDEARNSFLLSSEDENLQVESDNEFIKKLGCDEDAMVKVISIFGNTGDGKSHTLNYTFFKGEEVFKTSADQQSCTVGIWAAYEPHQKAIVIDTEGLLGVSSNQNQRTRLLLKVLAVSDVVIYRTRAERLHNDMFNFIGSASKAYLKHFSEELQTVSKKCKNNTSITTLGPAIVIFHETTHTEVFKTKGLGKNCPGIRERITDSECMMDAFSDIRYVGTKTNIGTQTDFLELKKVVVDILGNNSIRAHRRPAVVLQALKTLNEKFNGDIEKPTPNSFPDQYFTCTEKCLACGNRCIHSMNHNTQIDPHETSPEHICQYQHQYGNKVYLCKACKKSGHIRIVVPKTSSSSDNSWVGFGKYLWSGYVLECPKCGIIFRSRQYWYGNKEEEAVCEVDIRHIWPGSNRGLEGNHNAARKVLDGFHYVADTISTISAKPTKNLMEWTADQIAPEYWVPNSQILECSSCQVAFTSNTQKHHCRACGEGFCDSCSSKVRPVPERGWGFSAVRVCDECFDERKIKEKKAVAAAAGDSVHTARKVGEAVSSTIGVMASAIEYPLDILKDSARPDYWIPDEKINNCCVCKKDFDLLLSKHHCRSCGNGVCDYCSPNRLSVPIRGWDYPVRVCKNCEKNIEQI